MSQTLSLYRLQQIDSQMDRLKNRLQEIQTILDNDSELRNLHELTQKVSAQRLFAEQSVKQAEINVQNQLIKIEQTQASLYGDKSHNPKELLDLQNDVAALKRHLITLEDRLIEAMQESETADSNFQTIHAKVESAVNVQDELFNRLRQEQGTIGNELERLETEYSAVSSSIPVKDLDMYNQLRQKRRGVAVAVIGDNACGACGSTLSRAQIQFARSPEHMLLCPSCGRILYGS